MVASAVRPSVTAGEERQLAPKTGGGQYMISGFEELESFALLRAFK
jgi:hypothetical protein